MQHDALRVRVTTLNAWGLWGVAARRRERMAELANWLRDPACPADLVVLQEVWVASDVALLRQAADEGRLHHSFHFLGGAIGTGLLLLSRWPIADAAFRLYSARGDPARVLQGDHYAGKGVGWAALDTPAGLLSVFTTHLSANYEQQWQIGANGLPAVRLPRDELAGVRLLQVMELAAFVRSRAQGTVGTVLAGDLNAAPDTLEFAVLKALLPELQDAWAEACPLLLGATANALESSFTTAGAGHLPIRIDHILSSGRALHAELTLTDTGKGFSYSDHLGVSATLSFSGSDGDGDSCSGSERVSSAAPSNYGSAASSPIKPHSATSSPIKQQSATSSPIKPRSATSSPIKPRSATSSPIKQPAGLVPTALGLMRRFPEPFQEAAAQIEAAAAAAARGRRQFVGLAAGLWAAGFGCMGALAARPPDAHHHLLLLGGMGLAMGWAGAVFISGFVARGMEARALQQAALQLRLAVGTASAACRGMSPRPTL